MPTTNTWSGTGIWNSVANWDSGFVPSNGQSVLINGNVTLTNSTARLFSYTLSPGATNIFTGTNTILNASNVFIYGTVTHGINADTNPADGWQWTNRIYISCANFMLAPNGTINGDGMGYMGSRLLDLKGTNGYGPGGGLCYRPVANSYEGGGGGYGGAGGWGQGGPGGVTYGLLTMPEEPGSGGGGAYNQPAGDGGGSVRIDASGVATIYGTITMRGTRGFSNSGGGSGGAILINCDRLAGSTNGLLCVNGGDYFSAGGGGGGGRIAVNYNPASQTNNPGVRFSA